MTRLFTWLVVITLVGGLALAGWMSRSRLLEPPPRPAPSIVLREYEDWVGTVFKPVLIEPSQPRRLDRVDIPDLPGSSAIWGATGRDGNGRIWLGVSNDQGQERSARLVVYEPRTGEARVAGDVLRELRREGRLRVGEGQVKIHSKIVRGEDGCLYFSSMDEEGEKDDGNHLPTWGSHLWRVRLPEEQWEHLLAVPEGLVAVATAGQWVYALGLFGHVLYQYDIRTGKHSSVQVGSVGGHISRNIFADHRGHVFVPRVRNVGGRSVPSLLELDEYLREVRWTPLARYSTTPDDQSHGIVAFQPLADRSIAFTTDGGQLYLVTPQGDSAKVTDLGRIHPDGSAYVPSLFALDGKTFLAGLAHPQGARKKYEWVVYDLNNRTSRAFPIDIPTPIGQSPGGVLLYGCVTRDDAGRCYLVGTYSSEGRARAMVLKVWPG